MRPPIPADEDARLAKLKALQLVETCDEASFDDIVKLAQLICDMPIALVSLVTENTQWFKARVGLDLRETPRDHAICAHALEHSGALVVPDLRADARFVDNPLVTSDPSLRFYAGVPLRVAGEGSAMGTLCVLDRVPRTLSPTQLEALAALARRVEVEMTLRKDAVTKEWEREAKPDGNKVPALKVELRVNDLVGGRYRIQGFLGAGGMGSVYEAVEIGTDERVAIKVIRVSLASNEETVEPFAREARALLRLDSPHIVRFVDAGNLDDGSPYLVMEHLEGHDLSYRATQPLSVSDIVALGIQACDGTAAAHRAGFVHRDLKPANLFLVKDSHGKTTLKLLDFGIAKLVSASAEHAKPAHGAITEVSKVLGSPRYMSPEQLLSSRDVDASTDIWALGVVLFELLTGGHPFDGDSVTELCASIFTKTPRSVRELSPQVSPEFDAIVLRCLARDKHRRWPTVDALREALVALT